jgi:hypothetical protein
MVVENHPGAGAVVGTEFVARAPPDGGTLLMAANAFLINPQLRKLSYDPASSRFAASRPPRRSLSSTARRLTARSPIS